MRRDTFLYIFTQTSVVPHAGFSNKSESSTVERLLGRSIFKTESCAKDSKNQHLQYAISTKADELLTGRPETQEQQNKQMTLRVAC